MNENIPLKADILLIDIIGFTKLAQQQQFELIKFVTNTYKKMIETMLQNSNMTLDKLILGVNSTDYGFYCILNPRLQGYGAILGLSFYHLSQEISKKFRYFLGVKIAVHNGNVYTYSNILGQKEVTGEALHECADYLDLKNYSVSTVIVSLEAYNSFKKFLLIFKDYNTLLQDKGLKYSQEYQFKDIKGREKQGILIWLRESGIINPPNINFNSIIQD